MLTGYISQPKLLDEVKEGTQGAGDLRLELREELGEFSIL